MDVREIASGLQFPEAPLILPDGSLAVTEIRRGTLTRIGPDGRTTVIAQTGGGPNGAALGPDGHVYVCNNGGFAWHDLGGMLIPGEQPPEYSRGRIQRIRLDDGKVEDLYTECDGRPLRGPNDIVFDATGGFWFTDFGKMRARERDRTGVFYARPDGSEIREVIFPLDGPNGIGLSPDQKTLYVAETFCGRLWSWSIPSPGVVPDPGLPLGNGGTLVVGLPGMQMFDSLAVDADGNVCVATLVNGGITVVSPDGLHVEHVPMPDMMTTNLCFGGPELRTAYVTLSSSGRVVAVDWPRPGMRLSY